MPPPVVLLTGSQSTGHASPGSASNLSRNRLCWRRSRAPIPRVPASFWPSPASVRR